MKPIAHIELHDARLAEIVIRPGGTVRVEFEHICVYARVETELFEIWSVRALLQLEGVRDVEVRGVIQHDDYVAEGSMLDATGSEMVEVSPELLAGAKRVNLLFAGSGSEAHFSMREASFVIKEVLQNSEDWKGPLISKT